MFLAKIHMFDWDDLRHFLAYARAGSLSAAARDLGVDHVTVARRIAALERDLGLRLIERRARASVLTEDGQRLAVAGADVRAAAAKLERLLRSGDDMVAGTVTVSAPPSLASRVVAPSLSALMGEYRGLSVTLRGELRSASLGLNEADVAIRLTRPREGALTIRKVATLTFALYARASWWERPASELVFVTGDAATEGLPQQRWLAEIVGGRRVALRTDDIESQIAAARAGLGVAVLPVYAARDHADLVAGDGPTFARDVWLVVHDDVRAVPAVRLTADHLAQTLPAIVGSPSPAVGGSPPIHDGM